MRKYRCPIYMEHAAKLMSGWYARAKDADWPLSTTLDNCADELEDALRQDQHDLFHDAEFVDGCDICDQEREDQ